MVMTEIVYGEERAPAFEIRRLVFTDEQGIPADADQDGNDDMAYHFLASLDGKPVGTVRVRLFRNFGANYVKVERLAVLAEFRRSGIGRILMKAVEAWARNLAHLPFEIMLSSQADSADFYRTLGYQEMGEPYMEVGIPHIHMRMFL
jgi:predicted GNAT family N-acyltransferase